MSEKRDTSNGSFWWGYIKDIQEQEDELFLKHIQEVWDEVKKERHQAFMSFIGPFSRLYLLLPSSTQGKVEDFYWRIKGQ